MNRTQHKRSDIYIPHCIHFLLFIFLLGNYTSTAQVVDVIEFEASSRSIAYTSPFKHVPDGYKEVYYEEGMDAKLEEKTNLILPDIFFAYGDDAILPQSEYVLQDLVRILNDNPDLAIELSAHTDSRGRAGFNERLSKNRARNMVKFLTSNGVSASRLISIGYGEDMPRNHCGEGIVCSEQEHKENRRIEMRTARILGKLPTRSTYIYKNY